MIISRHLFLALLLLSGAAAAEIEKNAVPVETGIRMLWWPKVEAPQGWHYEQAESFRSAIKSFAPDGTTFSEAETVMYAKALYKPEAGRTRNLAQLIQDDIAEFRHAYPGMHVAAEPSVPGAGQQIKVMSFTPNGAGNWERVAYGEDGDYYILFTLSSRTPHGLERAIPAFLHMVASYRFGP